MDGNTTLRSTTSVITQGADVRSVVPFFWYNTTMEHTFGFFQEPGFVGCNPPATETQKEKKRWELYLIIPFVILFVVIVLLVIMFFMRRKWYNRRKKTGATHPMVAVGSEMVILPPSPPLSSTDSVSPLTHDPRASAAYVHPEPYHQDPRASLHDPRASLHDPRLSHYDPRASHYDPRASHTLHHHASVQFPEPAGDHYPPPSAPQQSPEPTNYIPPE